MRNFAILHIVADESRIFKTKERAPVMLCIEVYRPIEISLLKKPDFEELKKVSQVMIEETKAIEFNRSSIREVSKSITMQTARDQSYYPFESMDSA
jgi:hypothetical protein